MGREGTASGLASAALSFVHFCVTQRLAVELWLLLLASLWGGACTTRPFVRVHAAAAGPGVRFRSSPIGLQLLRRAGMNTVCALLIDLRVRLVIQTGPWCFDLAS